jgi:hypothetical protein
VDGVVGGGHERSPESIRLGVGLDGEREIGLDEGSLVVNLEEAHICWSFSKTSETGHEIELIMYESYHF